MCPNQKQELASNREMAGLHRGIFERVGFQGPTVPGVFPKIGNTRLSSPTLGTRCQTALRVSARCSVLTIPWNTQVTALRQTTKCLEIATPEFELQLVHLYQASHYRASSLK